MDGASASAVESELAVAQGASRPGEPGDRWAWARGSAERVLVRVGGLVLVASVDGVMLFFAVLRPQDEIGPACFWTAVGLHVAYLAAVLATRRPGDQRVPLGVIEYEAMRWLGSGRALERVASPPFGLTLTIPAGWRRYTPRDGRLFLGVGPPDGISWPLVLVGAARLRDGATLDDGFDALLGGGFAPWGELTVRSRDGAAIGGHPARSAAVAFAFRSASARFEGEGRVWLVEGPAGLVSILALTADAADARRAASIVGSLAFTPPA